MTAATVMVTGGSGFIGSSLVRHLQAQGTSVGVADLVPFPDDTVPCVTGDLRRPEVVEAALAPGTESVVHLAAMTSVLESVHRPAEVYQTNVAMTAALLERARQVGATSFVLASTNAVVGAGLASGTAQAGTAQAGTAQAGTAQAGTAQAGTAQAGTAQAQGHGAIDEWASLRPLTPYGATKAAAEMLLSAYAACYGMAACSLRLTNIYGPGMARKDSIVPRLMRAALSGATFRVYGDGLQVRDYLYVDDTVRALDLARRQRVTGPLTTGSGLSTTVLDLVAAAREVTGRPIPVEHVEPRPGEMRAVVVDTSLARSLGVKPEVPLVEGLAHAWEDFRRREG